MTKKKEARFQYWRLRKKSSDSSPRRKPGSRIPWISWIPRSDRGMTKNRVFGLFTKPSMLVCF